MQAKYKKMLEGMKKADQAIPKKRADKWYLYILRCGDDSLYTGITKDVEKRLKVHSAGKGARYTRSRLPLEVVYSETCKSRTDALVRECSVKALPKTKKLELTQTKKRRRKKSLKGHLSRKKK